MDWKVEVTRLAIFVAIASALLLWSMCLYWLGKRAGKREVADTLTLLRVRDENTTHLHSRTAHRICERLRHWARTGEIDDG